MQTATPAELGRLNLEQTEKALRRVGVKDVVETDGKGWKFSRAADWQEVSGTCIGWHVTDDPTRALRTFRERRDFDEGYLPHEKGQELGPGLYVSAVPHYWKGRSRKKWSFLDTLTREQRWALLTALLERVVKQTRDRYITRSEAESAIRELRAAAHNPSYVPAAVIHLANQPYNIASADPRFLLKLGISEGYQPKLLRVEFKGRYAFVEGGGFHHRAGYGIVRRLGFDGAFCVGGFSGDPQTVLWKRAAVISVELDTETDF